MRVVVRVKNDANEAVGDCLVLLHFRLQFAYCLEKHIQRQLITDSSVVKLKQFQLKNEIVLELNIFEEPDRLDEQENETNLRLAIEAAIETAHDGWFAQLLHGSSPYLMCCSLFTSSTLISLSSGQTTWSQ